jgi:Zn-dependent protease with chaperone function
VTKADYLLRRGVFRVGIPLAVLTNILLVFARGDGDIYWSARNAIEMAFTVMLMAPAVGVVAGNYMWRRLPRPLDAEAPQPAVPASTATSDAAHRSRQRRLAELAEHVETMAGRDPARLGRRLKLLTLLGYAYILAIVALLVGATVWLFLVRGEYEALTFRAALFMGVFAFVILSSLRVHFPEPTGVRVTRAGSPALIDALAEIARALDAPEPDVVLVTAEMNASATERPRFGIFGLPRRYVTVGLPLLEGLGADEARAILAHEMAHLARRHGQSHAWAARVSVAWQSLVVHLESTRHWGRRLFLPFFRWYSPRYALYAQAVSRRHEYDSDRLAAQCAGADAAVVALVRLHVLARFLSKRFFPRVYAGSARSAEPPAGVMEAIANAIRNDLDRTDLVRWMRSALGERARDSESHPSLRNRLASLGTTVETEAQFDALVNRAFAPVARTAADALLSEGRLAKLRVRVDAAWQRETLPQWRHWNTAAAFWQAAPATDQAYAQRVHAVWAAECAPTGEAIPLLRQVLERDPQDAEAGLLLGRLSLASEDPEDVAPGIELLEAAAARDSQLGISACTALETFFLAIDLPEAVARVQARQQRLRDALIAGLADRRHVSPDDQLEPYALPDTVLGLMRAGCPRIPAIQRAYLFRKRTKLLVDDVLLVVGLECRTRWFRASYKSPIPGAYLRTIQGLPKPADVSLVVVNLEPRSRLRKRIRELPGAEFYRA